MSLLTHRNDSQRLSTTDHNEFTMPFLLKHFHFLLPLEQKKKEKKIRFQHNKSPATVFLVSFLSRWLNPLSFSFTVPKKKKKTVHFFTVERGAFFLSRGRIMHGFSRWQDNFHVFPSLYPFFFFFSPHFLCKWFMVNGFLCFAFNIIGNGETETETETGLYSGHCIFYWEEHSEHIETFKKEQKKRNGE